MNNGFNTKDTNICKGIAILFMVLHHCIGKYYNSFDLSWYVANSDSIINEIVLFFSSAGKVCVSLLTILSGYGIAKKFSNYTNKTKRISYGRFVISRLVKFYSIYFPVYIVLFGIKMFLVWNRFSNAILYYDPDGNVTKALLNILIDFFGMFQLFKTPTIVYGWYQLAILTFYVLFPAFDYIIKKYKLSFIVVCCIYTILLGYRKADAFYAYLTEYSLGIYFAYSGLFDLMKKRIDIEHQIVSAICIIVSFILRIIFSLPIDILFAISIIFFEIEWLSSSCKLIENFGKHSANIWLLHTTLKWYVNMPNKFLLFFITFLISYVISCIIEEIKKKIKYNDLLYCVCNRIINVN